MNKHLHTYTHMHIYDTLSDFIMPVAIINTRIGIYQPITIFTNFEKYFTLPSKFYLLFITIHSGFCFCFL